MREYRKNNFYASIAVTVASAAALGLERYVLQLEDTPLKKTVDIAFQAGMYGGLAGILINGILATTDNAVDRKIREIRKDN